MIKTCVYILYIYFKNFRVYHSRGASRYICKNWKSVSTRALCTRKGYQPILIDVCIFLCLYRDVRNHMWTMWYLVSILIGMLIFPSTSVDRIKFLYFWSVDVTKSSLDTFRNIYGKHFLLSFFYSTFIYFFKDWYRCLQVLVFFFKRTGCVW